MFLNMNSLKKQMNDNKKVYVLIGNIVFIAFFLGLFIEARYTLPDGDDFGYFYLMKRASEYGHNTLVSAFKVAKIFYEEWGGGFVSVFLICFFDPFSKGGLEGFSFSCSLLLGIFFVVFCVFSRDLLRRVFVDRNLIIETIAMLIIFGGWIDMSDPMEIFYWYTCEISYLLSLILIMLFVVLCINYDSHKDASTLLFLLVFIISFLSGAIGNQGPFIMVGVALFIYTCGVVKERRIWIAFFTGFVPSIVAMISAPGNFKRNASNMMVDDTLISQLLLGVVNSTLCIARLMIKRVFMSPFFWLFVVLIIGLRLFGVSFVSIKHNTKSYIERMIASLILVYSAVYPVCFAYRLRFMSPRTESVAIFFIWLLVVYWVVDLSRYIRGLDLRGIRSKKHIYYFVSILSLCLLFSFLLTDNAGMRAYKELISGKPKTQWENWKQIYTEVQTSKDQTVEVLIDNEYISDLMTKHDVVEWNGESVISRSYMAYCGKELIKVVFTGLDETYILYGFNNPVSIEYHD